MARSASVPSRSLLFIINFSGGLSVGFLWSVGAGGPFLVTFEWRVSYVGLHSLSIALEVHMGMHGRGLVGGPRDPRGRRDRPVGETALGGSSVLGSLGWPDVWPFLGLGKSLIIIAGATLASRKVAAAVWLVVVGAVGAY